MRPQLSSLHTLLIAMGLIGLSTLRLSAQVDSNERFVAPPGEEPPAITAALDAVTAALASGRSRPSDVLADPALLTLHPWPRFRQAIRDHAAVGSLTLVTANEPGTALKLMARVVDGQGQPLRARVYLYQTSAKGWYSDQAPHISGNSGDQRHARLFGYLLTDEAGRFEVRTVRPVGYPGSTLPAHVHVEIETLTEPRRVRVTEVLFANDPRLTPEARSRALREGFVVGETVATAGGGEEVTVVLEVR